MNIRKSAVAVITAIFIGLSIPVSAGVAVIVHPDNAVKMTAAQVRSLFLAKKTSFPDGVAAKVYQLSQSDATTLFNKRILKKNESRLNSYWARMLFSSKGNPPKNMPSSEHMKSVVAEEKSAIGYLDSRDVDDSVRVLLEIE